jgi:hypothetical protein
MPEESTLSRPLRTPCTTTRPPAERWSAGSARRSTGVGDGSARSSPVRQDGGASSTRHAVPGGTRHCWIAVIRRDATMASVQGRLSHAWMHHTSYGVCRITPLRCTSCVVCRACGAHMPARYGVHAIQGSTPSCAQRPEPRHGCGHPRDDAPEGPVTRRTGEELREAGAHRGRGVSPEPHQSHTDHKEGFPHDVLHGSVLLHSPTMMRTQARQLLRMVPALVSSLPASPFIAVLPSRIASGRLYRCSESRVVTLGACPSHACTLARSAWGAAVPRSACTHHPWTSALYSVQCPAEKRRLMPPSPSFVCP